MMNKTMLCASVLLFGLCRAAEESQPLLPPSLHVSLSAQANLDKVLVFCNDVIESGNLSATRGLSGIFHAMCAATAAGIVDDESAQKYAVKIYARLQKDPTIGLSEVLILLNYALLIPKGYDLFGSQENAYSTTEFLKSNKAFPFTDEAKAVLSGAIIAKCYALEQKIVEAHDFVPGQHCFLGGEQEQ